MAKLKLVPNPTFTALVPIFVPGGDPVKVKFTFKHRTKTQLKEWLTSTAEGRKEMSDAEYLMEAVVGWDDVEGEDGAQAQFSKETFAEFLENHGAAVRAIITAYSDELSGAREKN